MEVLEADGAMFRMGGGSLDHQKRFAIDGFAWSLSKEIQVSQYTYGMHATSFDRRTMKNDIEQESLAAMLEECMPRVSLAHYNGRKRRHTPDCAMCFEAPFHCAPALP